MVIQKRTEGLGMPWEEEFGYAQAVQVGDTIYISGQLDHDAGGTMLAPAPLDEGGRITDYSNMEAQMRQAYANARILLGRFGATMDNVVEEVIYVLDMEAGFAAAPTVRRQAYAAAKPAVASTILVTPRLAQPAQLVEIQLKARV
jgi:enamine deaminase RidA (YjgF/YER057c/UK114 family)